MAELEQNSACSEETNSLCDEERVRKLFQACDGDGDGYIDSQDLLTVCRELNLEDSLEELMKELGADENGRISYKEFLRRRLALRPEIEALRSTPHLPRETVTPDYLPTSSDNSLGGASGGKCGESWEFDSGARDLSPEPNTLQRLVEAAGCSLTSTNTASLLQLANKLHLAALASLRGEILELTSRLHAVTQERDVLERAVAQAENSVAQQYEERLTELHSVIAELSRKMERQRTLVIAEEEDVQSETEQSIETCSQADETLAVEESTLPAFDESELQVEEITDAASKKEKKSFLEEELFELRAENSALQEQLSKTEAELQQTQTLLASVREDRDKLRNKLREGHHSLRPSSSPPPPRQEVPVLKVAERVRLRKMDRHVTGSDLISLGVTRTEVAEQLVSELQEECDQQELSLRDRRQLELETERLSARLEHSRSQVNVLQLTLDESKSHCERLCLLVGKYESNVTALRLALTSCDRAIEAYDLLVSLLDAHTNNEKCAEADELRQLIAELKAERALVRNTVVELESLVEQPPPRPPASTSQARKLDLETAVLMQELMAMREDKCELRAKIYLLERERENQELKVASLQSQQQAHLATIQHLQAQLQDADTEELDADGRESRLRERLKEVASTLERVSRNAELRQRQASELATELKTANSALVQSLERCKRKSQARLRRLDTQMLAMVERHAAQVRTLKQRIAALEESREQQQTRQSQNSTTSETSL
ncbi:colorectal mutant cancer protein isoform X2 [Homalodisca vitripennis]|nr:colorectal mutant cancer protein isoform X2 [Homalodisca vitripennis]